MPGCNTGRNIQKYKGSGGSVSTLQDVTDNGNTTTGDIITTSGFFIGDGSKLTGIAGVSSAFSFQETSDTGNTTSNTIQFTNTITSFTTSGNVLISGNVTASNFYGDGTTLSGVALSTDLGSNVLRIGAIETKTTDISYTNGTTRINGNLTVLGNTTTLDTVNLIVQDPILQLSNASASVDSGMLIARPSSTDNVFVGFDQSLSEFAIGFTDSHAGLSEIAIKDGEDFTLNIHGNVEASYYFGDGTTLSGVALNSDLSSNVIRIGNLESNLSANVIRIGNLESNLSANVIRIGNLESNLSANVIRIDDLESEIQPVNRGGTNITSYGIGDMLYASASTTLSKLTPSTAGYFLQTNGTGNAPTWENVADIGSATPANLYTDDFITGGPWSGITDANLRVLGNVSNLSNQLVARDDKGDIFVSNVNAINIYGDGTSLIGVALNTDLSSNSTRLGNLESNLAANVIRITNLESNLSANVIRIGNLESNLTANSIRITNLQKSTIISNSSSITDAFETGDLIYASGQNTLSNLSIGTINQVLTVSSGIPTWATPSSSGSSVWSESSGNAYRSSGNVGISNTAPAHTLSVGTVVSIQETSTGDVLIVRGNGHFSDEVYIAKKLTLPSGSKLIADTINIRSLNVKETQVVAERPASQVSI
jgi:hypothetical protein